MNRLFVICACVMLLGGCSWDDWQSADHWLDQHCGKVRTRPGPFSHQAMYENSIAEPFMTPMDNK
jgi:hypothetical protein